jgi:hypothetical protein
MNNDEREDLHRLVERAFGCKTYSILSFKGKSPRILIALAEMAGIAVASCFSEHCLVSGDPF